MHDVVTTICILALLASSHAIASKPICPDAKLDTYEWVEKHLAAADVVLLGTVISSETPSYEEFRSRQDARFAEAGPASSMQDLLERIEESQAQPTDYSAWPYATVSFEVLKRWKGPEFRIFSAKHRVFGHGGSLPIGQTYLLFGYQQEGSIFTISTACGEVLDAERAEDRIEALTEIVEANKPPDDSLH